MNIFNKSGWYHRVRRANETIKALFYLTSIIWYFMVYGVVECKYIENALYSLQTHFYLDKLFILTL